MKNFIKILAVLFTLALVIVLVPVVILVTIDLNQYKDVLADTVKQQTGRELQLQGELNKSFFPWLGVNIGALQLSNAQGFGDAPFAQLQQVQVQVKLLPLFKKELVVDKVILHGLQINLARNKQGITNWNDLLVQSADQRSQKEPQEEPQKETPTEEPQAPSSRAQPSKPLKQQLAALSVSGVDIKGAALSWDDRQAGVRYSLSDVDVQTGQVQPGHPFTVDMALNFNASQPQAKGALRWRGTIDAQLEQQRYRITGLEVNADVSAEVLPIAKLTMALSADVDSDLEKQTASLSKLRLKILGSELSGGLQADNIMAEPAVEAQLQWLVTDAETLVKDLQHLLPPKSSPKVQAALLKDASVNLEAKVSLATQKASITPLALKVAGIQVDAEVDAAEILDNPRYKGSVAVQAFNPRLLLKELAVQLPEMADDKALTNVALNTSYRGSTNDITLNPVAITLDDTNIQGYASVHQFDDPRIEYLLNVDGIDVDRYMPPESPKPKKEADKQPAGEKAPSKPKTPADDDIPLPMEPLRTLKLKGELNVGNLKAMNMKLAKLKVGVDAKDGLLKADPIEAQLYRGASKTAITMDVRQDTPIFEISEQLSGVDFGPLIKDMMEDDYVSGIANIQANLTTSGAKVSLLKQNLNGKFTFDFTDGVMKHLDIADLLLEDYSKYLRKALPEDQPDKTTAFKVLKGTATITNGTVKNKDLLLESTRFKVKGEGGVHLVKETIAYTAKTEIINPTNSMIKYDMDKLVGIPIPIHFRGTFSEPDYNVDWEGVLKKLAKQRLKTEEQKVKKKAKDKLEEEKKKLKEKSKQKREEEKEKLKQKLKDKLKKYF